jgi:hypothetical protein
MDKYVDLENGGFGLECCVDWGNFIPSSLSVSQVFCAIPQNRPIVVVDDIVFRFYSELEFDFESGMLRLVVDGVQRTIDCTLALYEKRATGRECVVFSTA